MLIPSLRARLFGALALLILVTGLAASTLAFQWSFSEAIELQDAILLQIGALARRSQFHYEIPAMEGVGADARVIIQELTGGSDGASSNEMLSGIPGDLADGLHTVALKDGTWRILVRTRRNGTRVAIAQTAAARDEIARASAVRTALPLFALVPCLLVLVGFVIHRSFQPVALLAATLDAKENDHMERLPTDGMPSELRPFIESINRLLGRIAILFAQQRHFIADAAHELRSPITALGIQADNLANTELPEQSRLRLSMLRSGIDRIAHLLEQLLALAKYDKRGVVTEIRLDLIVKNVVSEVLALAESRSVDLGFARFEEVPLCAEATAITTLVRNLVDNAIRYAFAGGQIDISVFRVEDRAFLVVEDSGPGIAEADMKQIFEPFNRGSFPRGEGTGLGLSIVRRVVENYQGSIALENLTDRTGLRATVMLPTN